MRPPQVSVMMVEEVAVRCPGLVATVQVEIVPPVLTSLEEIVAENNRSGAIQRSGLSEIGTCHILVHERMSQFPIIAYSDGICSKVVFLYLEP